MSENIEQAVREVARFLATDPTHVTGQNTRHARIIVAIVERNLTPRAVDLPTESRQPSWDDDGLDDAVIGCLP